MEKMKIPEYIGSLAFGVKMGVILPGMDIVEEILKPLSKCNRDSLLDSGDVICITESIVARAQNNYITVDDIAREIKEKLNLAKDAKLAVVFPIASRNRFSMILKGLARAVPEGEVLVQLSCPSDEVGNQVISPEFVEKLDNKVITFNELKGYQFKHPVTGVDYINLYRSLIEEEGARPNIILSNDPVQALEAQPDGVVVADIHTRAETIKVIKKHFSNCITLEQICNEGDKYSEWGLLGSNLSSGERLKLAPREGKQVVKELQARVKQDFGLTVEVMIYGDGAYLDPTSGIYELADPKAAFAATDGLDCFREGVKYKYLADQFFYEGHSNTDEIESFISKEAKRKVAKDCQEREGTTPRRMEDVLASLADLVSGSADAGTPVVLVKNFLV
ncbi:MAG: coenzyme F420-0:L-glutamate ligase [Bacillota bacterium]